MAINYKDIFKDGGITPTLIVETKEQCKTNMAAHNLMEFISVYSAAPGTTLNSIHFCSVRLICPCPQVHYKHCNISCISSAAQDRCLDRTCATPNVPMFVSVFLIGCIYSCVCLHLLHFTLVLFCQCVDQRVSA